MTSPVVVHLTDMIENRSVVDRLVSENMSGKLDRYVADATLNADLNLEKNKKGLFNGTLRGKVGPQDFYFTRDDYKKLDDLVNHLFDHLKNQLSNK